jgi:hypothetical protein
MTATQKTDPFAALPRWSATISDDARLYGRKATILSTQSTDRCTLRRAVTAFASPRVTCDSNRGFKSEPAAAFKSP